MKVLIFLFSIILCGHVFASNVNYGIGTSMNGKESIYLPIKYNSISIEPAINYYSSDSDFGENSSNGMSESNTMRVGVGIFNTNSVKNSVIVYYGIRIGYNKSKSEYTSSNSTSKNTSDGYFISPTLGAHYFLISNFSIGLETFYDYEKFKGESSNSLSTERSQSSFTQTGTGGAIIVRYYFNK